VNVHSLFSSKAFSPAAPTPDPQLIGQRYRDIAAARGWRGHHHVDDRTVIDLTDGSKIPNLSNGLGNTEPYRDGYFRTPAEMAELEQIILSLVPDDMGINGPSGLVAIGIDGDCALSDWGRTMEMSYNWYDMPEWMAGYEAASMIAIVADFHYPTGPKITIAGRNIIGPRTDPASTGSQVVDSVLDQVTTEDILRHHELTDLRASMDFTTYYRVPNTRSKVHKAGYAPYLLLAGLREFIRFDCESSFGYTNRLSEQSLERQFFPSEQIAGKEVRAPLVGGHEYNAEYIAIYLNMRSYADLAFNPESPFASMLEPLVMTPVPGLRIKVS
jgi:hypothetical protein